jgi:hypothetical protein
MGTYSYDSRRNGLWVYDLKDDGTVDGKPRKYRDHPDPMPEPLTPGGWSSVTAIYLDTKHNKLFLGVGVAGVKGFENFKNPLVMYNLDANGEPIGTPQAFDTGNQYKHVAAICMHPKLNRLYTSGFGFAAVSAFDLDSNGVPVSKPIVYPVGGIGKYSISIRSDGTKMYLGTYPETLEVCDLDANGAVVRSRTYPVQGGPNEYMIQVATDRGVYFKGTGGNLSWFSLDASGEPSGSAKTLVDCPVQAVSMSPVANRILVAMASTFDDALTGNRITGGVQVKELDTGTDGTPGSVTREGPAYNRESAFCLNGSPAPAIATKFLGWGFLGNRVSGLEVRTTLISAEVDGALPPAVTYVTMGPEQRYLKFVYSSLRGRVYVAGENAIYVYAPGFAGAKVVSVPCANLTGALALDEVQGILYAARKDGNIAVRQLDANGVPEAAGKEVQAGVNPISNLAFNQKARVLYVFGTPQKESPGAANFVKVQAGIYEGESAIDPEKGKLYVVGLYNGNENLAVWDLLPDGKLAADKPKRYGDGFDTAKKKRSLIYSVVLDAKRSKLYLGGGLENPAVGESGVVIYDLDASGNPSGAPRLFATSSKYNSTWGIALSANRRYLYEVGWGAPQVFEWPLDEKGEPSGKPSVWETSGNGKDQVFAVGDGSMVLLGTHPSILEVIPLAKNGRPAGWLSASFSTDKGETKIGFLREGIPSEWTSMDTWLRDGVGLCRINCTLSGARVKKAVAKFEFRKIEQSGVKLLKTFTVTTAGNSIAVFAPKYGLDDPSRVADMIQSSVDKFREYLGYAEKYALKPEERPKELIVANGLISLDGTPETLENGLKLLSLLGHNTVQIWNWGNISPEEMRSTAEKYGFNRFRGAIYNPPSYFDYNTDMVTKEYLDKWAADLRKTYSYMGMKPEEVVLYHMADEPGWYYPYSIDEVKKKPERLAVFRDYLKSKGFTPVAFGKNSWDEIFPMKLSEPKTLADKRLYFWTTRFFAESLSKAFAAATQAFQRQFNQKILTTTNLNNWPGRFFIPSPGAKIANNWDSGPDAGMGMPDWFDLGRKKGVSCIWTEDWFGDNAAQNWSLYCDLLRCAARTGGVEFGGYVVGHTTGGSMPDGGKYKIMSIFGHGGKAIDPYTFGPGLAFGDGWSERESVYESLATGIRMLGKSEKLIAPGRPRNGTVAILFSQASQPWDPDSKWYAYSWEIYGLHAALIHDHYPVDFIDDFDIEDGALNKYGYQTLYVTGPNLSEKAQRTISDWVRNGGVLALMPGACTADEYNEMTVNITKLTGAQQGNLQKVYHVQPDELARRPEIRIEVKDTRLESSGITTVFKAVTLTPTTGKVLAGFADGSAAVVETVVGKGKIISYGYWPGITYNITPDRTDYTRLPCNWSKDARKIATYPARAAGARKYVDISEDVIEGCLLESDRGIAVTLLNWTGEPQKEITVTIPGASGISKVESVEQGVLKYENAPDGLKVKLPLKTVDVLMLYK